MTSSEAANPRRPRRPHADVTPQDLVDARTALGMTLGELADATGISERTLGAWERGAVTPNRANLGKLKTYLQRRRVPLGGGPRHIVGNPTIQVILNDSHLSEADKATMVALYQRLQNRE